MSKMSYCVNCGVELEKGIKACPLCDTPVINPRETQAEEPITPSYPRAVAIPDSVRKKYFVFIASMVLFIPAVVLAVADLIYIEGNWPAYFIASSALTWVLFVFPFMWKKTLPYLLLIIDCIAFTLFLYVIYYFSGREQGWFASIAMPIVISLTLLAAIFIKWNKTHRDWPFVVITILIEFACESLIVDIVANLFYYEKLVVTVSPVIAACCFALVAFFAVTAKSKRFRAWVSRRFFV